MIQEQQNWTTSTRESALFQQIDEYAPLPQENALLDLELKESALVAYEQAIQLVPHEASLHYHKGQVLEQLGRLTEAENAYTRARHLGFSEAPHA